MKTKILKYIPVTLAVIWQIFWILVYAWSDFENTHGYALFLATLICGSVAIVQTIYYCKKAEVTLANQASVMLIATVVYGLSYFLYGHLTVLHALLAM
jgi:Ca2+/Na+ antiporter